MRVEIGVTEKGQRRLAAMRTRVKLERQTRTRQALANLNDQQQEFTGTGCISLSYCEAHKLLQSRTGGPSEWQRTEMNERGPTVKFFPD